MGDKKSLIFGLLENGLDFIQSGIKYLVNYKDKSDLKYGILHLSAGVEVILKYRLSKEHWSLLFQHVDKANKVRLESGDFVSVDFETSIKRLKEICSVDLGEEHQANIRTLRDKRNKMEHFSIMDSPEAVKVIFNKVLCFVIDFIEEQFDKTDLTQDELDTLENIRRSLSDLDEFIKHRWKAIQKDVDEKRKTLSVTYCPVCYQDAMAVDIGGKCLFCHQSYDDAEQLANDYINNILGINSYSTVKDGGVYPLFNCVDCGAEAFVDAEDGGWFCFSCGVRYSNNEINYCETCGTPYIVEEHDIGMCDSCIENRIGD